MLKRILLFVVALLVLLLIIGFLLPFEFKVERSISINVPVEKVFVQVADLNNYVKWNTWSEQDPEAKVTLSVPSSGVGSSWSWEGEIIGKGSLSIIKLEDGESIETIVLFYEPGQSEASGFWKFESTVKGTNVGWTLKGNLSYPVERYMGFFIDDILGRDLEKGLANLKRRCEK